MTSETRQRLFAAVTELLDEEGLEGFSLRKVAARAGVSHSAPGALFGSGRRMLTAYAAEGFDRLGAVLTEAEAEARDGSEALAAVGRAYVSFATTEAARFTVMFRTERLEASEPTYVASSQAALQPVASAIGRCRAEGRLDERDDPDHVTVAAWSLVHGAATLWFSRHLSTHLQRDPDELARQVTGVFVRILRPAPR